MKLSQKIKNLRRIWRNRLRLTKTQWAYLLLQPVFYPIVLWLDDLRSAGAYLGAGVLFTLLEVLGVVDTLLFMVIFGSKK